MAKKLVVHRDGWDQYSYKGPEGIVVVSYFTGSQQIDRASFPHCARVITPCADDKASAEKAWALEDQLTALLEYNAVNCVMVGTLRHSGTRELVFQVADWETFRPVVGKWFQGNRSVALDVSEHDGWDFFERCIWPDDDTARFIADRRTVELLVEKGSNPAKPHDLEWSFKGHDERLSAFAELLSARGYRRWEGKLAPGSLVMVKSMPLDVDQIFRESQQNDRSARGAGVECDGWGASIIS